MENLALLKLRISVLEKNIRSKNRKYFLSTDQEKIFVNYNLKKGLYSRMYSTTLKFQNKKKIFF